MDPFVLVGEHFTVESADLTEAELAQIADEVSRAAREAAQEYVRRLAAEQPSVRVRTGGERMTRSTIRERVFSAPERAQERRRLTRQQDPGGGGETLACA
jgi:hypothetical protein